MMVAFIAPSEGQRYNARSASRKGNSLRLALAIGLTFFALPLFSQTPQSVQVGPLAGGWFVLNSGWGINPAGKQIDVDTFPIRSTVSANGKYLLVLNAGYDHPSISVIDVAAQRELHRVPVPDAWLGLTFGPDDANVYVGGGSKASVYEFKFNSDTGELSPARTFSAVNNASDAAQSFIGDVALSPDGHLLYAADVMENEIAVINLRSGRLIGRWKCGRRPYRILVAPDNQSLLVSSWADAMLYRYDALSGGKKGVIRTGQHPTDILWLNKPFVAEETQQTQYQGRLFVAAANTNSVYSYGLTAQGEFRLLQTISLSTTPLQPLGITPSALAADRGGKQLYVACSGINAVAVVDISQPPSRVIGFLPAGWYPTAVTALPNGGAAIVNGKGKGSYPNPKGPNPAVAADLASVQFVGRIQRGTVQIIPAFDNQQLRTFTETVKQSAAYNSDQLRDAFRGGNIEAFIKEGDHPSPIKHVVYIIKSGRTYDQIFGDMPKGKGDKSLVVFGRETTPNQHKLASEFVLYDNFYDNGDVSADGQNWAAGAIAPDFTVKLWPSSYAGRRQAGDYEGGPANLPPAGYLWSNALQAGINIRSYGEWVTNLPLNQAQSGRQVKEVKDPALAPFTDLNYRGFDLNYSDVDRANEFLREWKDFEGKGNAPQLSIVQLANDRTAGSAAGKDAAAKAVADNDYALGKIVDGVSHSKFWPSTAIFVVEDSAQDGADHVDAHRAPALVISPYTRRGGMVDSTMYNQTGVLRTIEGILGLHPLTQFDAAAETMFGSFSLRPDPAPFDAEPPHAAQAVK
jgi:DNA-binding beta-propeller fold protein YncE/phospholipase C